MNGMSLKQQVNSMTPKSSHLLNMMNGNHQQQSKAKMAQPIILINNNSPVQTKGTPTPKQSSILENLINQVKSGNNGFQTPNNLLNNNQNGTGLQRTFSNKF